MSNYGYPFAAEPDFTRYVQMADGQYRSHHAAQQQQQHQPSSAQYAAAVPVPGHAQPLPSPSPSSLVPPSVASSVVRGFSYSAALLGSTSREESSSNSSSSSSNSRISGGFERMADADQHQQQQHYFDQLRQQQQSAQQPHRQHAVAHHPQQQQQQPAQHRHLPSAAVKRQYDYQHHHHQHQHDDELHLSHFLPHHSHHSRHPLLAAHDVDPHSPLSPPSSLLPLSALGNGDGGVKQESQSPIRDDLSAASGCSQSQSQPEQPLDPFVHRFPFSFIVHLRSGDRSFLPRSVVAPLSVSASQLLHLAANISGFLTLHSPSSPPVSQDVPLMSLPVVQQRASEQAAALRAGVLESLPPFKPCSPVLLPRNTPLAMQQPPPPLKSKRKDEAADIADDEDDEEMDDAVNSHAGCSFLLSPPVSDPQHLHLLFDLSEDVKPCTRLGCGNMLVKKSSRRSCDDCQLSGHTLHTAQLLQFFIPSEFPQPAAVSPSSPDCLRYFSTLTAAEQLLVCAQLQTAMDAVLHKVEHWKFEMPEHRAFILAFASAESAQLASQLFSRHFGLPPAPPVSAPSALLPPVSASPTPSPVHVSDTTDSEPSVSSRSRSSAGLSAEDVVSDGEAECGRRRKNSHSLSSTSSSSVDLAARSIGSTTSNSSASASSASSPHSELASPVPQPCAAAELAAVPAPELLPGYPYLAHLLPMADQTAEYSLKMKSHFWKLEVRPTGQQAEAAAAAAAAGGGKKPVVRVKSYKKIGSKRVVSGRASSGAARSGSRVVLPAQPVNGSICGSLQPLADKDGRAELTGAASSLPVSSAPALPAGRSRTSPSLTSQGDAVQGSETRRRLSSDSDGKASPAAQLGFLPGAPHASHRQSATIFSQLPLSSPTSGLFPHCALETDPEMSHLLHNHGHDCEPELSIQGFGLEDEDGQPLSSSPTEYDAVDRFLSSHDLLDSSHFPSASAHSHSSNSVLVSSFDHEHLLQQKPIGATLSVYQPPQQQAVAEEAKAAVSLPSATPVLLVYGGDARQYQWDASHGRLDRQGPGGGSNGRKGGGGGGRGGRDSEQERKNGNGSSRRGQDGDGDDNGRKRRRVDGRQRAGDVAAAPPQDGDGGDKQKDGGKDGWESEKAWLYRGAVAPSPPSVIAALLHSHYSTVIWFWLLLALAVMAVVVFTLSWSRASSDFSVVQVRPDYPLIHSHQVTTLSNAASLLSQMRLASPVFNAWATSVPSLLLYDDDASTDIIYHVLTRQLDVVPGSVVTSYTPNAVLTQQQVNALRLDHAMIVNYSDVVVRCGEATNTAKAVGDFLVAANALGPSFAYHFLGTALTVLNLTDNSSAIDSAAPTWPPGSGSSSSSTAAAGAFSPGRRSFSSSSSSTTGVSGGGGHDGLSSVSAASTSAMSDSSSSSGDQQGPPIVGPDYILDYDESTLSWPPKPAATCLLMNHEVGFAFIQSFLCHSAQRAPHPYNALLAADCSEGVAFNCTAFLADVFAWNLTNIVFAVQGEQYAADPLMLALRYHQSAATIAPACTYFQIMTGDVLDTAITGSTKTDVNVGLLLAQVMGGAAILAVGIMLIVMTANAALKWRDEKIRIQRLQRRKKEAEERKREERLQEVPPHPQQRLHAPQRRWPSRVEERRDVDIGIELEGAAVV